MALVKQKLTGGEEYMYMDYTRDGGCIYIFTNKFTCNFIEGEGNTCWKETYYINPADIRKRDVYYEKWKRY